MSQYLDRDVCLEHYCECIVRALLRLVVVPAILGKSFDLTVFFLDLQQYIDSEYSKQVQNKQLCLKKTNLLLLAVSW